MAKQTTAGRLLLEEALPDEYKNFAGELDKKELFKLLSLIAQTHPEKYNDVTFAMQQIGKEASMETGGFSPSILHLRKSPAARRIRDKFKKEYIGIMKNPYTTTDQKNAKIINLVQRVSKEQQDAIYDEQLAMKNPFAMQVKTGARGSKANLASLLGADYGYVDAKSNPIMVPVTHGYAEGLRPTEYFAGSYGTRKGVADTKLAVGAAGYLSKQLLQMVHRNVITGDDDDERQPDLLRGLPSSVNDEDNIGTLLARPIVDKQTGETLYKRNDVVDRQMLSDLKERGVEDILIRSPLVGGPGDGSLFARDVGVRELGRLPLRGENPSITAVQSLAEPLGQGALSCLAEGTLVRMGDFTTKKIEDIKVGDMVLGVNGDMIASPVRVSAVFDNGLQECNEYVFRVDKTQATVRVVCTDQHRFQAYAEQSAKPVQSVTHVSGLTTSETMTQDSENYSRQSHHVYHKEVETPVGVQRVYDLEIENRTHLYVLASGLITHNSKHSGGVFGQTSKAVGGFKAVNQMIQATKAPRSGATHSDVDGKVEGIADAPGGGKVILIDGKEHYVRPDHDVQVKVGDVVEAGDILTDGTPDSAAMVKYKHIGEGRRYFMEQLHKVFRDAGINTNRRNVELLARGAVNHVRLNEEYKEFVPGDIIPYSMLERDYTPRVNSYKKKTSESIGRYLEKPVLHYTIGTRITPRTVQQMQRYGIDELEVNDDPPIFEPEMVRGVANLQHDPDVMVRMYGSGIRKGVLSSVGRGGYSNPYGTSFVSGLLGDPDFANPKGKGKVVSPMPVFDFKVAHEKAGAYFDPLDPNDYDEVEEVELDDSEDDVPVDNFDEISYPDWDAYLSQ